MARAYGPLDQTERTRLTTHRVLHTVAERSWISSDRPTGWMASVARLDAELVRRTARSVGLPSRDLR